MTSDGQGGDKAAENAGGPSAARVQSVPGEGQGDTVTPLLPPRAPMEARPMPEHPLGDPDREWREPSRLLRAVMSDGWTAKDGPELLRLLDAAGLLDLFFATAEWTIRTHPDEAVRAFAWRMVDAGEVVRRGDKDADGRAIPLGRLLGIQPPAPTSAARKLDLQSRDRLLRKARAEVPEWRDLPARQAAPLMIQSFERYRQGQWREERKKRKTAPAVEPKASWWRILRLRIAIKMPKVAQLSKILDREDLDE